MGTPTVDPVSREAAKVFADPTAYADEPRLHAALKSRCEGVVDRVLPIFLTATDASKACVTAALKEFRE